MNFFEKMRDLHAEKVRRNAQNAQMTGNAIYSAFAAADARNYRHSASAARSLGLLRKPGS